MLNVDLIILIPLLHVYEAYDLKVEWNMFDEMSKRKVF